MKLPELLAEEEARLKWLEENDPVKRKARARRRLKIFLWHLVTPHFLRKYVLGKVNIRRTMQTPLPYYPQDLQKNASHHALYITPGYDQKSRKPPRKHQNGLECTKTF